MDPEQENTNQPMPETETPVTTDENDTSGQPATSEEHASKNLIIIAVLAVIVIVLALLYVWGSSKQVEAPTIPTPLPLDEPVPADPQQNSGVVSTSDDVTSIESDLNTTELETLDTEMNDMMIELDAALDAEVQ